ncbi:MAG: tRNA (N6-threonylcarbamoyladenosine(37)-N6)-methyltransferase TrmO [Ruminococcaceae bacterium]|nr:tRNA (N6-threonylcarbamoyladenosine(37)-N6)-methyltransferase TrmO [Oscillospiraceae bacterium]
MKIIAKIHNEFTEKFGIPRQSGLSSAISEIRFEPHYRNIDALRYIDKFSHLWLIWEFSESKLEDWSPTVRPPRLGGNKKVGVFASRSPFRPNPLGLTVVELIKVKISEKYGPVLIVKGADMLNGTPIYDIKPYIPFSDCISDAKDGFTLETKKHKLEVIFPDNIAKDIDKDTLKELSEILSFDPRPSYHADDREYGMTYGKFNIKFKVSDNVLTVIKADT